MEDFSSALSAWIAQTWISFIVAIAATGIGIFNMPVDIANFIKV
ncbi:MAG: hypothetical protein IGR92_04900 [Leptolyngbyaceae cyanobacterium T60_A2020_046]|nr:hypothetical protein [Leptolyngbyaceae cyanobacterium T60_A2020_046]